MKKVVYLVSGLAFFFVVSLIGLALYLASTLELSRNRDKTAAAREKRWAHKRNPETLEDLAGKSEEEINRALDNLNDKRNENEV